MKVQVKICATRNLEAARATADAGAEFLGMVFTPNTKHTIERRVAKQIGEVMKSRTALVGVFQNMPLSEVQETIAECHLDYAQFHGDESPEYISHITIPVIKAFRFPGSFSLNEARRQMQQFHVAYYLVDRIKQSEGPMLDLGTVSALAKEFPLVFAGGLTPENVAEVIRKVKPKIVDVASGVETDAQQDSGKIKEFINNAKEILI